MNIAKYEHACLTVEESEKVVVIDPGTLTTNLKTPENVVAVIVTHEHGDHFDPSALGALIARNPDAVIIGPKAVTRQLGDTLPTRTVTAGESVTIGPFQFQFFGGEHAIIHDSIPQIDNLGVMINETLCYPGDSFSMPPMPVNTLALPVSAPWMKLSEAIDYLRAVKPTRAFPTHDALYSSIGRAMVDQMIGGMAKAQNTNYLRIDESGLSI